MKSQPPKRIVLVSERYQARMSLPVAWSAGPLRVRRAMPTIQRATASRPGVPRRGSRTCSSCGAPFERDDGGFVVISRAASELPLKIRLRRT